jgi:endonuclease YncB( thermonuclease family)
MMRFRYYLTVDHVYDGDTLVGVIDMGLGHYLGRAPAPLWRIRFADANAPELHVEGGDRARAFIAGLCGPGDELPFVAVGWDKYGMRVDGIVYGSDEATSSLGEILIANGLASKP